MQDHPNSIITRICFRAGIQLKKGQAAKIQAEVPDLDPERVLAAARRIRSKGAPGKEGTAPSPKKRIRTFLSRRVDGFMAANPQFDAPRMTLVDAAVEDLAVTFPEAATGPVIPEEDLDRALMAAASRVRERAAMNAWLGGLRWAKLILRDVLTPELWRSYEGRLGELEEEVRRRSLEALAGWGAEEVPDHDRLARALSTPLPVEGSDPVAEERRDWARVWEEALLRVEARCGPEGALRRSRNNRLMLLARMFPGLGGEGAEKDRVAALDALIREREVESALRRTKEADAARARRAWEARLVRRDELETLLPATKAETLRWIQDGRIPVALRRGFQKWGKDLQVTLHDPDLLPDWRARIDAWRAADADGATGRARSVRSRVALESRIRNLLTAALPDGASRPALIALDKGRPRFAADLVAPIDLTVRDGAEPLSLPVPMRVELPPELWGPVAEGPVTGAARKEAVGAMRDGLARLLDGFRVAAAPGLAALREELRTRLDDLPEEMLITFRDGLEASVLLSRVDGRAPDRLGPFLRGHATGVLNRVTELHRDRVLGRASGLADYPALFPQARLVRRQIHLHLGPTNSGKTHAAIERLKAAPTGLYAAPLRLMAMEWADRLNADGVPTDLVTGEELIRVDGARHQSVTIEMSPLRTPVDVAVIDEAQLIGDEERGWAWTQAVLGLPARELHLTGSPDAEPWVRLLVEMTGDVLTLHRYERLVPLLPTSGTVRPAEVRAGDAIVAFSRASVMRLRSEVAAFGFEVATIYGALSPEVRREEARRFRSGEAEVVVATDAIGMGMNLPVRRVLLAEGGKFDGVERRPLLDTEIRQIVGRAGRFGLTDGEPGLAGTYEGGVPEVADALQDRISRIIEGRVRPKVPEAVRPMVKPGGEVVRLLGELMGTDRLLPILQTVHERILSRDPVFRSGIGPEMMLVASVMDRTPLPLEDRHAYACAPVDTRDETSWDGLMRWVRAHAAGERVPYDVDRGRSGKVRTQGELAALESRVKATGLYLWCAHRWPEVYTEAEKAMARRSALNAAISAALRGGTLSRSCRECGLGLRDGHRFAICDDCHRESRYFRDWD
jgi:ATP-dependent RNA helicase SUPV3L1/SUV3